MKVTVFTTSRYSNFFHYHKSKDIRVHFVIKLILIKKLNWRKIDFFVL